MNEKSIAIKREIGNPQSLALTIGNLGFTYFEVKNYEKSLRLFKECYEISEEIGNKRLMTFALGGLGYASKAIGDLEKSEEYFKNSLKISKEHGMKDKTINTLIGLSDLSSITDDFDKALNYLKEALDLVVPLKIESSILELLTIFARILIKKNNLERAIKILSLIVNHSQSTKSTKDTAEDLLEDCKKQISEDKFKEPFTKGTSLELDGVVEELLKEL
jgi:tetratricopeptide (TPR) repeat protein